MSKTLQIMQHQSHFCCKTCSMKVEDLGQLLHHVMNHVEACGFFYEFATKTAHIKFSSVSTGCQTDLTSADETTWAEADGNDSSVTHDTEASENCWQGTFGTIEIKLDIDENWDEQYIEKNNCDEQYIEENNCDEQYIEENNCDEQSLVDIPNSTNFSISELPTENESLNNITAPLFIKTETGLSETCDNGIFNNEQRQERTDDSNCQQTAYFFDNSQAEDCNLILEVKTENEPSKVKTLPDRRRNGQFKKKFVIYSYDEESVNEVCAGSLRRKKYGTCKSKTKQAGRFEEENETHKVKALPGRQRNGQFKKKSAKHSSDEESVDELHKESVQMKKYGICKGKVIKIETKPKQAKLDDSESDWTPDMNYHKTMGRKTKRKKKQNQTKLGTDRINKTEPVEERGVKTEPFKKRKYSQAMSRKKLRLTIDKNANSQDKFKEKVSKVFDCSLCPEKAHSTRYIRKHIETVHEGMYKLSCKTCCIPFVTEEQLKVHTDTCSDKTVKSYSCFECENRRLFTSETNLKEHIKKKHDSRNPLKCTVCEVELLSPYHERKHMAEHNEDSLRCQQCNYVANNVGFYDLHMTAHFRSLTSFACFLCNKETTDFKFLTTHYLCHLDKVVNYVCESCGDGFGTHRELYLHRKWCNNKLHCKMCDKHFIRPDVYEEHILYGHTDPSLKPACDQCGASFLSVKTLKTHKRMQHSGTVPLFTCPYCSKAFKRKTVYNRHLLIHTDVYQYPCSYCKKNFRTKWNRDAHERQHTGEKPYSCTKCGAGFTHNVVRKTHEAKCDNINSNIQEKNIQQ